jgi:hypothetical protein
MESLTRLVTDSLVRHGFDRPIDPRRLQWSRWFRCDSPHSLLVVPSKPGIFALAEEIMPLSPSADHVGTDAFGSLPRAESRGPAEQSSAAASTTTNAEVSKDPTQRRMLAILQFSEDDDMAFTLDRMFTRINPMRDRLASKLCFLRFVVIEDQTQRRSICTALNHWMLSSAEKASGLSADFQSSLEFTADRVPAGRVTTDRVGRTLLSDSANSIPSAAQATQPGRETDSAPAPPHPDSGADKNLHCPHPLPSGF